MRKAPGVRLARFIVRRLILGLLTLILISIVVFAGTQALPGDAARAVLGKTATPENLKFVRKELHLDRPLMSQYWSWLSGVVRGDLGRSLSSQEFAPESGGDDTVQPFGAPARALPVSTLISDRVRNSAFLVGAAILIAFPLSIAIGARAAYRRDKLFDHVTSFVSLGLAALPEFVIALSLVLVLSTGAFHLLPAVSLVDPSLPVWRQTSKVALPALVLIIWELPYLTRLVRASMIEVLESDYVEMARLKGLPEWKVVSRHALPNAAVPVIHVMALQIALLAGGIVVVEFVFGFPGIGQALVEAVTNRDLPVVQAVSLLIAGIYVVVNLLADVATILLSPRLRTSPSFA